MKKMSRITFEELPEFNSDLKRLMKKYRSLNDDLDVLRKVLNLESDEKPPFSFKISGLKIEICVIKIKKIACRSLKGRGVNSGLRVVYAYYKEEQKIVFIEIYFKSEKENEDRGRILKKFK